MVSVPFRSVRPGYCVSGSKPNFSGCYEAFSVLRARCAGMQPKRFVGPWGFGEAQRYGAVTVGQRRKQEHVVFCREWPPCHSSPGYCVSGSKPNFSGCYEAFSVLRARCAGMQPKRFETAPSCDTWRAGINVRSGVLNLFTTAVFRRISAPAQ